MTNKWQIKLDVTEEEKSKLVGLLEDEVSTLRSVQDLTADADEWDEISKRISSLEQLQSQINLSWIEKEVEIIPPPSKWSKHFTHAVDHSTNPL